MANKTKAELQKEIRSLRTMSSLLNGRRGLVAITSRYRRPKVRTLKITGATVFSVVFALILLAVVIAATGE